MHVHFLKLLWPGDRGFVIHFAFIIKKKNPPNYKKFSSHMPFNRNVKKELHIYWEMDTLLLKSP